MAKRGPGKFSSDLDAALYALSLDGGADAEAGSSSEGNGWYGFMPDGEDLARAIDAREKEEPFNSVSLDDLKFLRKEGKAGVIIFESTDGSVDVTLYASKSDLDKDWQEVEESQSDDEYESNRGRRRNGEEDVLRDETIEPFLKGKGPVFRIQTWETGKTDRAHGRNSPFIGHRITMTEPGGAPEVVFEGEDYSPSPMIDADSDRTLDDIVAFFVNDYDDDNRTPRQREVVKKYGDTLGGEASMLFGEDSEREENRRGRRASNGSTYAVRLVHKISPSDKDTLAPITIPGNAFSNRNTLAKALRDARVLGSGVQLSDMRVEGNKVVAFPRTGIWHSVILTALDEEDARTPNGQAAWLVLLNGEQTDIVYFSEDMDAADVKRSLVNHDGYDPRITVKKRERRKTHAPDALAPNARRRTAR